MGEAIDLQLFRRDNAYVYQTRQGITEAHYLLTAHFAKSVDRLSLWSSLAEDRLFGCHVIDFNGERLVSRDLLDSIIEINFLEDTLGISSLGGLRVLDIGAGYGRFAHRLVGSLPNLKEVLCTDAVAESTFVSDFYLRYRGVQDKALVIPLDEIEWRLASAPPAIATNIHSFSECPLAAIEWWLGLLSRVGVRYFFLVPNTGQELISTERGGPRGPRPRKDFAPALAAAGYRLRHSRAKFDGASSLERCGLFPTHYFLFELER